MSMIDDLANQILDQLLGTSGLLPGTVYIGLLLNAPNSDGTNVNEPPGFNYARVAVTNNATQWPNAVSRIKTHANDIVFPMANGGSWGTITHGAVFDASVGGNIRIVGSLTTPRVVADQDIFRFLASTNALRLTTPFAP